jgi:RNA polymerase sigma-70 factor (ECF subfamily)
MTIDRLPDPEGPSDAMLEALRQGDAAAAEQLLPILYAELRALAASYLRDQHAGHTLQATALVHEAWLKVSQRTGRNWDGRSHFFAVAARAMRQILVDHARGRASAKRGGGWDKVTLAYGLVAARGGPSVDLVALNDALDKLADLDPVQAHVVELRFFSGLEVDEVAGILDMSSRTVVRKWRVARAWLGVELAEVEPG